MKMINQTETQDRAYCVQVLRRIADPVLQALVANQLKMKLPVGLPERQSFAPLEAFGRLIAGMAPWLELGPGDDEEARMRADYIRLVVEGLRHAVNPESPDFMNFDQGEGGQPEQGGQPLVDTAYLAQALLRAPVQLWQNLGAKTQTHVIAAFKATRVFKPWDNNWLLFSATIEAALWKLSGECRIEPIEYAVKKHLEWYKGDGIYGDGSDFHWDYYNSYVIHPMLLDVLKVCVAEGHPLAEHYPIILCRAQRYAAILERLISPEGTYPVIGRSSAYRFAAFQNLALMALLEQLPAGLEPTAVRAGLTAVIRRSIETPGTFDGEGWLRQGAVGHQPGIVEWYSSTSSLYICSAGLLHLGLSTDHPFWTGPALPWTQKKIWSGEDVPPDHALA